MYVGVDFFFNNYPLLAYISHYLKNFNKHYNFHYCGVMATQLTTIVLLSIQYIINIKVQFVGFYTHLDLINPQDGTY
jgi:hypothetical protein